MGHIIPTFNFLGETMPHLLFYPTGCPVDMATICVIRKKNSHIITVAIPIANIPIIPIATNASIG